MSYKELFSSIDCKRIIIIEDDFKQSEYKKERALYDIIRMAVDDRCQYRLISTEQAMQAERDFYRFVVDDYVMYQVRQRIPEQVHIRNFQSLDIRFDALAYCLLFECREAHHPVFE